MRLSQLALLTSVLLSSAVMADEGWKFDPNKANPNEEFYQKLPEPIYDDAKDYNDIQLNKAQKEQAATWGLTENQEKRYLCLMQHRSGVYYKNNNMSPVDVLGNNARDDAERRSLAELKVKQDSQRIAKELSFTKAYATAYQDMVNKYNLPVVRNFDTSKYSPYSYEAIKLKENDKLMLFVNSHDAAKRLITPLINAVVKYPKSQLNIYFMDKSIATTDIQNWAKSHNIPAKLANSNIVTLNRGYDKYSNVKDIKNSPKLFLLRDGKSSAVDLSRF